MKFRKIIIAILIIAIMAATLGENYDSMELNQAAYIIAIGIDKGTENAVRVTVKIPVYKSDSGGGSSKGSESGDLVTYSIDGKSIMGALDMVRTNLNRRLSLAHIKMIIISEEAARDGIMKYLLVLAQSREVNDSCYILISRQTAYEFIEKYSASLGSNVFPEIDMLSNTVTSENHLGMISFTKFYSALVSPYHSSYASYCSLSKEEIENKEKEDKEDKKDKKDKEDKKDKDEDKDEDEDEGDETSKSDKNDKKDKSDSDNSNGAGDVDDKKNDMSEKSIIEKPRQGMLNIDAEYLAGEMPVKRHRKVEFVGTAIFSDDKLVDVLTNINTRIMQIIRGGIKSAKFVLRSPHEDNKAITLNIESKPSKIVVTKIPNSDLFKVKIVIRPHVEIFASEIPNEYEYPTKFYEVQNACRDQLYERIKTFIKRTQEINYDIFNIGYHIARNFATIKEFEGYNWFEKYKSTPIEVDLDLNIRRMAITTN